MAPSQASRPSDDDPLLARVPKREGYRILPPCAVYGRIGQGGMGTVFLGRHLNLDVDVAIKVLDPKLAESSSFVARFHQEAKAAARVAHGNLVRVFDVGFAHGLHYIVLEYVEGETARDRVERKGRLAVAEAVEIALGAARGLAAAHRAGLVHRDVKPENVLVSAQGEVKLADLGLAKSHSTENVGMTQTGMTLGTPRYMSPEQWRDSRKVGPAGDVWALGATLWYLLEGTDPLEGESAVEVMVRATTEPFPDLARADVPAALREILARCTRRTPSERYASGVELASALEAFQRESSVPLADPKAGSKVGRKSLVSPPPPKQTLELLRTQKLDAPEERRPRVTSGRHLLIGASMLLVLGFLGYRFGWSGLARGEESEKPATGIDGRDMTQGPGSAAAIALDLPLDSDGRWFTSESVAQIEGRVDNARSDRIELRQGGEATPYLLQGGRFEIPLVLARDAANQVELAAEGAEEPLRFDVVQDSRPPLLELVAPPANPWTTKESRFDLRVRVDEENLARLVCSNRPLTELEQGVWGAAGIALPAEGENRFVLEAKDCVGLTTALELAVTRDTRAPALMSAVPQSGASLEPGADVAFELTFDEPIVSASLAGQALAVEGSTVRGTLRAPDSAGPWRPHLDVTDRAANGKSLDFSFDVGTRVRVPNGWEIVDAAPPTGASAQTAGRARNAGWAWRARDPRTGITFLLVEPGTFRMGSPDSEEGRAVDEGPVHDVRLTEAFYLGETEVSVAAWRKFVDEANYTTESEEGEGGYTLNAAGIWMRDVGATWRDPLPFHGHIGGEDLAVTQVTWNDVSAFCDHYGYRLPTEAEWEYAARAGTTSRYFWGDVESDGTGCGNFADQSSKKKFSHWTVFPFDDGFVFTAPVGSFRARGGNPWGFLDILGNVWEWCADAYDEGFYARSPLENPFNDPGESRLVRGGAWINLPAVCRAALRNSFAPAVTYSNVGFRAARTLP